MRTPYAYLDWVQEKSIARPEFSFAREILEKREKISERPFSRPTTSFRPRISVFGFLSDLGVRTSPAAGWLSEQFGWN